MLLAALMVLNAGLFLCLLTLGSLVLVTLLVLQVAAILCVRLYIYFWRDVDI